MEAKKSVGIWIRVSTEDQAQGESPQHHEQRARPDDHDDDQAGNTLLEEVTPWCAGRQ